MADSSVRYPSEGTYQPNVRRTDRIVVRLAEPYGGREGQEGALLNGLLAMGIDPALVRTFADADPNRRFLDDAITRALRAGIPEDAIRRALQATRAAATGDPQAAIKALGVDPATLPPEGRAVYDSIANRQPLPFLDRGQIAPHVTEVPAAPLPGDVRAVDRQSAPPRPTEPLRQPQPQQQPTGTLGGTLGGGGTTTGQPTPGLRNLPSLAPNAPPEEVERYIRKHYGYHAWILDIPELRDKMIELGRQFAGAPEISELAVEGALGDTEWWKTHTGAQRLAIEEKATDPATYNAKIESKYREMALLAGQVGFTVSEPRLREMARNAYDMGWTTPEMRAALAAEFDYNPETGEEDQTRIVADLRATASDYLVPLGEQTIDQWGRQIVAGTATNEDFAAYAKSMAKGMFAHWAGDIDAGRTIKQIADPFVQTAMKDLELTQDQIDLMDPKWRKALELDPETGQPMQLSKWQRTIRQDSAYGWDYTQNARSEAAEFAKQIATAFGRA